MIEIMISSRTANTIQLVQEHPLLGLGSGSGFGSGSGTREYKPVLNSYLFTILHNPVGQILSSKARLLEDFTKIYFTSNL